MFPPQPVQLRPVEGLHNPKIMVWRELLNLVLDDRGVQGVFPGLSGSATIKPFPAAQRPQAIWPGPQHYDFASDGESLVGYSSKTVNRDRSWPIKRASPSRARSRLASTPAAPSNATASSAGHFAVTGLGREHAARGPLIECWITMCGHGLGRCEPGHTPRPRSGDADHRPAVSVQKLENGGYQVELQDANVVQLTREEMEAAATGAHYEGDHPEARAFATLCYATMAKRAQMMGHEGSDTYAEALRSLANGEVTKDVPEYLGLGDKVHKIDVDEIEDHDGVVAYGNGHAVFVDEVDGEHYTDAWGNPHEYDGTNEVDKPDNELEGAYYFEV